MKVKVIYENRAQTFEEKLSQFLTIVKKEGFIESIKFSTIEIDRQPTYSALVVYDVKKVETSEKKPVSKK